MPRPILGTCALTVLQQQRRGRAVATGQHHCTTIARRVRIRDRTQHTWTALHTRSKRSAKVRRHSLIRPRSLCSIPARFPVKLIRPSAGRLSQQLAHHAVLHGLITSWRLDPARAPAAFPLSGRSRTTQRPIRRHSCRLSGVSFVDFPLLDHTMSYVTKKSSLSCARRPTSKPLEH